ncbi:MAG: carboxypeptidase-like regulatory domain-containing protein [Planctomycetota bacterium]
MRVHASVLLTCLLAVGCGGSQPPPAPTTPTVAAFTLSGNTRETAPSPTPPIAGARVEITEGPRAGESAVTDSSGLYTFTGLTQQTLALRVSMEGYETETRAQVVVNADTRLDFGLGRTWPPELARMMQRVPLPLLKFKSAPGTGPSYYVSGSTATPYVAGIVVYVSPAPTTGAIGSIAHELCHAHQDRAVRDAGMSGALSAYYNTEEGRHFIAMTGWSMQGGAWVEPPCELWSCGYANPIEDSAQSCATYNNPEGYQFAGTDYMRRYAPHRYEWAMRWLPTP